MRYCPKCNKETIAMLGTEPDGKGGFVKKYECLDSDCGQEWTEYPDAEDRKAYGEV